MKKKNQGAQMDSITLWYFVKKKNWKKNFQVNFKNDEHKYFVKKIKNLKVIYKNDENKYFVKKKEFKS